METKKEFIQLLNYAYRYLSYRMRTEYEVKRYLMEKAQKRGFPTEYIKEVIKRLIEDKYINDDLFIEEYVNARSKAKPKSAFALTQELQQKGVNQTKIQDYFEEHSIDEYALAKKALLKKWSIYQHLIPLKRFKKASDFLQRRGFSFSIVKKTIEELES